MVNKKCFKVHNTYKKKKRNKKENNCPYSVMAKAFPEENDWFTLVLYLAKSPTWITVVYSSADVYKVKGKNDPCFSLIFNMIRKCNSAQNKRFISSL